MALDDLIFGNEEYNEDEATEEYTLAGPQIPIKIMEQYFSLSISEMKKAADNYKIEYGNGDMDTPLYEETLSEIFIKGSKLRVDTEEEGMKMSMLIDIETNDVKIIRWDQKIVVNMDYEKIKDQMEEAMRDYGIENDEIVQSDIELQSTGITKEINGFKCELYKGTDSENNYEHVWLSKSVDDELINAFRKMSQMFSNINSEEYSEAEFDFYVNSNSLPILTKSISSGEVIQIEEILKIEEKTVDDSQFVVPKGFQEMDMSEMMRQELPH